MTDWEQQLKRRAAAITRAERLRDLDIAAAHNDGLAWRKIGTAAGINHESARKIGERVAKEQARAPAEPDGP